MDNKPNSDTEVPIYTSTDIASTKARAEQQYFTNVQKASPLRKFSEWFAKKRAANLEASQARQAAFKAKRAERRRQADIAALSREVPTMAPVMKNARGAVAGPAAQPVAQPAVQPIVQSPAQPQPQPIVQQPIAQPTPQKSSSKKSTLILAILVGLLLVAAIIILIVLKPWDTPAPAKPTAAAPDAATQLTANLDDLKELYKEAGLGQVQQSLDYQISHTPDDVEIARLQNLAIRFYLSINRLDLAVATLSDLDTTQVEEADLYSLYVAVASGYLQNNDLANSQKYDNLAYALPGARDFQMGGTDADACPPATAETADEATDAANAETTDDTSAEDAD